MTNTTPLLRCAHCRVSVFYNLEAAERDRGDWVLRCSECGAENVLTLRLPAEAEVPVFEIVGWRDAPSLSVSNL